MNLELVITAEVDGDVEDYNYIKVRLGGHRIAFLGPYHRQLTEQDVEEVVGQWFEDRLGEKEFRV
jgi:hypothetical protein